MKDKYSVKFKCVFCGSEEFIIPEEKYKPKAGEQIKCAKCGRLNDCESLHDLAVKEGIKAVKQDFDQEIKKIFKKAGFKIK